MTEIHNREGKLIATIHDPEAFAQLVDEFEELLKRYRVITCPLSRLPNFASLVGQSAIDDAITAAENLEQMRRQFGDTHDNLYPSKFRA
jgi:hypothetical protein